MSLGIRILLAGVFCSALMAGCSTGNQYGSQESALRALNIVPNEVELHDQQLNPNRHKILSVVTGDSCQATFRGAPASTLDAQQALRNDAARFNATDVFAVQCFNIPTDSSARCYTQVSCVGKATVPKQ